MLRSNVFRKRSPTTAAAPKHGKHGKMDIRGCRTLYDLDMHWMRKVALRRPRTAVLAGVQHLSVCVPVRHGERILFERTSQSGPGHALKLRSRSPQ